MTARVSLWLSTIIFDHFGIRPAWSTPGTRNQMFTLTTLEECECVNNKGQVGAHSMIFYHIESQEKSTDELNRMYLLLAQRESEIEHLQAQIQQAFYGMDGGIGTTT